MAATPETAEKSITSGEIVDDEDEGGEWEEWTAEVGGREAEDAEEEPALCLFCSSEFSSPAETFAHCASVHGFDFEAVRSSHQLTFYECVQVINYVRKQVSESRCSACGEGFGLRQDLLEHQKTAGHFWLAGLRSNSRKESADRTLPWQREEYLRPALQDDPLLFSFEGDEDMEDEDDSVKRQAERENQSGAVSSGEGSFSRDQVPGGRNPPVVVPEERGLQFAQGLADEILALRLENEELRSALTAAEAKGQGKRGIGKVPPTPHPTPVGSPMRVFSKETNLQTSALKAVAEQAEEERGEKDERRLEPEEAMTSKEGAPEEEDDMPRGEALEEDLELVEEKNEIDPDFVTVGASGEGGNWPVRGRGRGRSRGKKGKGKVKFGGVAEREARGVDSSYFSSYSAFGIHREMLGDKVRTLAYRSALVDNPSLLAGAKVMDVGCGTGILSLFAAQAGASQVVAVDGSAKIATVARQVADANGYLAGGTQQAPAGKGRPVITVVEGLVEDLRSGDISLISSNPAAPSSLGSTEDDKTSTIVLPDAGRKVSLQGTAVTPVVAAGAGKGGGGSSGKNVVPLEEKSVDVLVSEWMGYCLLFESMLSSVLHARDKWLKPGGAILPDIATMYVAGFGRGGTSLPFWEDVYGFSMNAIGREVVEDAAEVPVVDVIAAKDVITEPCLIQSVDLATMGHDDVDFTSYFHLELGHPPATQVTNPDTTAVTSVATRTMPGATEMGSGLPAVAAQPAADAAGPSQESAAKSHGGASEEGATEWCYGLVVWFDVEFSERFCKDKPVVMSTSPMGTPTHWSQTLLTFKEPIALQRAAADKTDSVQSNSTIAGERPSRKEAIGTANEPAVAINGRISIVRGTRHRSIDISLETALMGKDGAVRRWPAQIFDI